MKKQYALMLSVAALLLSTLAIPSSAEARPWGVNYRQNRQQTRISQGINSGSLNSREAARLERQQAQLAQREAHMRASGCGLSANERARLQHQQNQLSRNIYSQKHDRRWH